MASRGTGNGAPGTTPAHAAFELEQFCWTAPDRLDVTGSFVGLGPAATGAPVLVIEGPDGVRRLPALDDGASPPPEEGRPWSAAFAWLDPPVAFDHARLQLGDAHVELPAPDSEPVDRRLVVHLPDAPRREPAVSASPAATTHDVGAGGMEAIRMTADLLEAREEARELRIAIEHMTQDLTRAREDLEDEQQRRASDLQRFSDGLAQVRTAAEEALAAEQRAVDQLHSEVSRLREEAESQDRELTEAKAGLESAAAERAASEALRSRLTELERAAEESTSLRSELQTALQRAEAAEGDIHALRTTLDEARTDVERLLSRLSPTRDAFGAPG